MKFVLALALCAQVALAHVRLREPPQRSSLWRDGRFDDLNPPTNLGDDAIYCGQIPMPDPVPEDRCGPCGDIGSAAVPRPNEWGGQYSREIIAGNYSAGATIQIDSQITINHNGGFQLHICDQVPETDACFNRNPKLQIMLPNGSWGLDHPIGGAGWINTTARLPPGLSCRNCVLRLHWRGNHAVGECPDGSEQMGCGPQQTYRNCADISISL